MIYLVHFCEPYEHAEHYLGFTENLPARLERHRTGLGSPLLKAVTDAGIPWGVVRVWRSGNRTDERQMKGKGSKRLCPVCSGKNAYRRGCLRNLQRLRRGRPQ